ncbi:MAG: glycosyltransferase [Planctomycetota bacterium]|nr:MAG: glycosyltransferase [Planctomycetota bacterium]
MTRGTCAPGPREVLVVFVREPVAGRTKTRLARTIGPERAAELYRVMVEEVARETARVAGCGRARWLWVAPARACETVGRWLGGFDRVLGQPEGDLGVRQQAAFEAAFSAGAGRVVVIGSDCVALRAPLLEAAFAALGEADAVLGPATDGGYYLLGLRRPVPGLFDAVRWSAATVCATIEQRLERAGCTTVRLPVLGDVDTALDLAAAAAECPALRTACRRLGVLREGGGGAGATSSGIECSAGSIPSGEERERPKEEPRCR